MKNWKCILFLQWWSTLYFSILCCYLVFQNLLTWYSGQLQCQSNLLNNLFYAKENDMKEQYSNNQVYEWILKEAIFKCLVLNVSLLFHLYTVFLDI